MSFDRDVFDYYSKYYGTEEAERRLQNLSEEDDTEEDSTELSKGRYISAEEIRILNEKISTLTIESRRQFDLIEEQKGQIEILNAEITKVKAERDAFAEIIRNQKTMSDAGLDIPPPPPLLPSQDIPLPPPPPPLPEEMTKAQATADGTTALTIVNGGSVVPALPPLPGSLPPPPKAPRAGIKPPSPGDLPPPPAVMGGGSKKGPLKFNPNELAKAAEDLKKRQATGQLRKQDIKQKGKPVTRDDLFKDVREAGKKRQEKIQKGELVPKTNLRKENPTAPPLPGRPLAGDLAAQAKKLRKVGPPRTGKDKPLPKKQGLAGDLSNALDKRRGAFQSQEDSEEDSYDSWDSEDLEHQVIWIDNLVPGDFDRLHTLTIAECSNCRIATYVKTRMKGYPNNYCSRVCAREHYDWCVEQGHII